MFQYSLFVKIIYIQLICRYTRRYRSISYRNINIHRSYFTSIRFYPIVIDILFRYRHPQERSKLYNNRLIHLSHKPIYRLLKQKRSYWICQYSHYFTLISHLMHPTLTIRMYTRRLLAWRKKKAMLKKLRDSGLHALHHEGQG